MTVEPGSGAGRWLGFRRALHQGVRQVWHGSLATAGIKETEHGASATSQAAGRGRVVALESFFSHAVSATGLQAEVP